MKLNSIFLVLFLIISIKSRNILNSFSIDDFKHHLKKIGLFQIIQSIKNTYGQDVAIISCEELNKNYNGNCRKLVTDYIEENPKAELKKGFKAPTQSWKRSYDSKKKLNNI